MRFRTSWLARLLRGRRLDGTRWGYDSAARQAQAQRASLVQVTATLLRASPVLTGYGSTSGFTVEARWRAPDGPVQTGELFVTADVAAGHSTRIWVDRADRLTGPPLNRDQMTGRAQLAAGVRSAASPPC